MINLIWAQSKNEMIAKDGIIPWHLKTDLQNFKMLTTNQVVLMGAKTYDALPVKPLPNRINLVLSHREVNQFVDGVEKVRSIDQAIKIAEKANKDLFVIGGVQLYQQALERADVIYQTIVDLQVSDGLQLKLDLSSFKLEKSDNYLAGADDQYNFSINQYLK